MGANHDDLLQAAQNLGRKDELMEQRRADRRDHQHKQIWTKDPHGGAYRKVHSKRFWIRQENVSRGVKTALHTSNDDKGAELMSCG